MKSWVIWHAGGGIPCRLQPPAATQRQLVIDAAPRVLYERSLEHNNYVDNEKPFDRVDWIKLMEILQGLELTGETGGWFETCIMDRQHMSGLEIATRVIVVFV